MSFVIVHGTHEYVKIRPTVLSVFNDGSHILRRVQIPQSSGFLSFMLD